MNNRTLNQRVNREPKPTKPTEPNQLHRNRKTLEYPETI